MRVRILGRLEVLTDAGVCLNLGTPKQRTVCAMLLARAGQLVTVEQLIDELWPDNPPASAVANARTYAANLRRLFHSAAGPCLRLESRGIGYILHVAPDQFDMLVFQRLLQQSRDEVNRGDLVGATEHLQGAVDLWRGQPFEDLPTGPVLAVRRAVLCDAYAAAIEDRGENLLVLGLDRAAIALLREHVHTHRTRERGWELLIEALRSTGDVAGALTAFADARAALVEQLGVEPGARLRELQQILLRGGDIRRTSPATRSVTHAPVDGVSFSAPGDRRQNPPPRCLPRPIRDFTGHEELVAQLVIQLDEDDPPLVTIDGMAGAGKTTLAVHVAAQVTERYPDGQLYLDLHGSSENSPLDPGTALNLLLGQLGVTAGQLPVGLEERAARWRTEVANRRVLILLDNVADSRQATPLLPGTSRSAVLVTSRRRLGGLHDARHVSLDLLRPADAVRLLTRIVGEGAVAAQPQAAADVVRLCGYLPLAVRIAGARLASRPSWSVGDLARRLRVADTPIVALTVEGNSMTAAFTLSYRHLPALTQRMFRLVGQHPGHDFDEHAAAALVGLSPEQALDPLEELVDVHLLEQPTAGRYRLHDLLRDYARHLSRSMDSADENDSALTRLAEYYLHTLVNASKWLIRGMVLDGLEWDCVSPHARSFDDNKAGLTWLTTEWRNVLAMAWCALDLGWHRRACQLSLALWPSVYRRGYNEQIAAVQERIVQSEAKLGDRHLVGLTHHYLAGSYSRLALWGKAIHHLDRALRMWRTEGDARLEAQALSNYTFVLTLSGRSQEAIKYGRQAVQLAEEFPDDAVCPRAHEALGSVCMTVGDYHAALGHLRYAATMYLLMKDGLYSNALVELGQVHGRLGHLTVAEALLTRAVTLKRLAGNPFGAAEALSECGVVHLRGNRPEQALACQLQALEEGPRGGDPQIEALLNNNLSETLCAIGDLPRALKHGRTALRIAENANYPYEQARAHARIAAALTNDPAEAATHWEKALVMHTDMGTPERHEASEQLRKLRGTPPI